MQFKNSMHRILLNVKYNSCNFTALDNTRIKCVLHGDFPEKKNTTYMKKLFTTSRYVLKCVEETITAFHYSVVCFWSSGKTLFG